METRKKFKNVVKKTEHKLHEVGNALKHRDKTKIKNPDYIADKTDLTSNNEINTYLDDESWEDIEATVKQHFSDVVVDNLKAAHQGYKNITEENKASDHIQKNIDDCLPPNYKPLPLPNVKPITTNPVKIPQETNTTSKVMTTNQIKQELLDANIPLESDYIIKEEFPPIILNETQQKLPPIPEQKDEPDFPSPKLLYFSDAPPNYKPLPLPNVKPITTNSVAIPNAEIKTTNNVTNTTNQIQKLLAANIPSESDNIINEELPPIILEETKKELPPILELKNVPILHTNNRQKPTAKKSFNFFCCCGTVDDEENHENKLLKTSGIQYS